MSFVHKFEPILSKLFFLIFFCFLLKAPKCLETLDNIIWSHNVQITGNYQPRQHRCKEDRYYKDLEEKAH